MQGILDLLLHILTIPQSPVTHLRAVACALQALDSFGVELFCEITGTALQHWVRVVIGLMNSTALSVRSIAVDFIISLLGSSFDSFGTVDEMCLLFASVLPEVVAREIALHSVNDLITTEDQLCRVIWPLRRALGDIHDANPLDDDRVDPFLQSILEKFSRSCQAIVDGVLIEMRLKGSNFRVVGTLINMQNTKCLVFDADEESLLEAASFFDGESSPIQRIRWFRSLKELHQSRGKYVEAAESLLLCAETTVQSFLSLKTIWRPSQFKLWSDSRRSLWLDAVGEEKGVPSRGNSQVMDFAEEYLEPSHLLGSNRKRTPAGKLQQPSVFSLCNSFTAIVEEAVELYERGGSVHVLPPRLEVLAKELSSVRDQLRSQTRATNNASRKRFLEDDSALGLAVEYLYQKIPLLISLSRPAVEPPHREIDYDTGTALFSDSYFLLHLLGKKPPRFEDNAAVPTFVEWDFPCVLRISQGAFIPGTLRTGAAKEWVQGLADALQPDKDPRMELIIETTPSRSAVEPGDSRTFVRFFSISPRNTEGRCKRFVYDTGNGRIAEVSVARSFPGPLSRQRVLLSSYTSNTTD